MMNPRLVGILTIALALPAGAARGQASCLDKAQAELAQMWKIDPAEVCKGGPKDPGAVLKEKIKKKYEDCIAALTKDYKKAQETLAAAAKTTQPLQEFWAEQCGQAKEPAEIVALLLGVPPGHPGLDSDEGVVMLAAAQGRLNGLRGRIGETDYAALFDGQRGALANLAGPAGGGVKAGGGAADVMTPKVVRDLLAKPEFADQLKLSGQLYADMKKDWATTAQGQELLADWNKHGVPDVPIVVGQIPDPKTGAFYDVHGKYVAINSTLLAQTYAWAQGKDDLELSAYLAAHPDERRTMMYDLGDMLFHEGVHAAQFTKRPLHSKHDVPSKTYLALEEDAKMRAAAYFMERVELERKDGKDYLAKSDNRYVREARGEALFLALQGSDKFRKNIRDLYVSVKGDEAVTFSQGIKLQEERVKTEGSPGRKKKLAAGLAALKDADAFYTEELAKVGVSSRKGAGRFTIAAGKGLVAVNPNQAINVMYLGIEMAKKDDAKWVETQAGVLTRDFERALDAEKAHLKKNCGGDSPSQDCLKRKKDLEAGCAYIGRESC